tara:strand:+ start:1551 stop:4271 length:2721 start_codon:yes stop_codon:yes gene_type:complete
MTQKINIYNPFTDKIVKINKFGRTAKRIYKYYIDSGISPDDILPSNLIYINGKIKKLKTIINYNNVRRITYAEVKPTGLGDKYAYDIIKTYKGQTVKLAKKYISDNIVYEGEEIIYLDSKGLSQAYMFLRISSEEHLFSPFNNNLSPNQQAQLLILSLDKVDAENVEQYFLDGISHCVFTPIKNWALDKKDNCNNNNTVKKYNSILNKIDKYENIYNKGVPEKDLTDIANDLQISIEIDLPSTLKSDTRFLSFDSQKKPLKKFKYLNTRLNHIELNEINNLSNYIEVNQKELDDIYYKNYDKFIMYKKNRERLTQVITVDGVYICSNSKYKEAVEDLTYKLDCCRIEYNSNKDLSDYIFDNLNNPYMKSFIDIEFDDEIKPVYNFNHIDIKKAYATCDQCDYYKGYLGKITDFRECNKIMGIGIYTITNIECNIDIINELEYLFDGNAYPSPELEYFKSLGIKFNIIGGCWGDCIKFTIPDIMYEKIEGVKHYCRWYGCLMKLDKVNRYQFTCKDIELAQLNAFNNEDITIRSNGYKEAIIEYPKKYIYHQAHIASFIHGYTRITMIQQLLKFKNINQIKVVNVDGIYYEGEVDIMDRFSNKEQKDLKYINNDGTYGCSCENIIEFPKFRNNNKIEVHLGCGGSGKTHYNLMDSGFINKLYVAPSWKLAKEKQLEYNINSAVFQRLLTDDPEIWKKYYNLYNVIIIDEISMMTDKEKEKIINRFDRHKIIFCGDVGFQLPPIEGVEFKINNKYPIINHTKNYRCKCPKLLNILNNMRKEISKGSWFYDIKKLGLPIIKLKDLDYKPQDLIISKTNSRKDLITATFKDLEKYVVLANYNKYTNTQILLEKPPKGIRHELRHGYTIYSCQGETAKNKLFIDVKNLKDIKTIYTALSRAKYLSQIVFFD